MPVKAVASYNYFKHECADKGETMDVACPAGAAVADFFDHNGSDYVHERYKWYAQIREDLGPVFWSPHHGGYWVAIGFEEVMEAAKDWETFSSKHFVGPDLATCPVDGIAYGGLFMPAKPVSFPLIEEDPPQWEESRTVLAPLFSLPAVERWRVRVQELVDACLDRHIESGEIDFAKAISNIVPAIFSMEFVGVTPEQFELVARNHHLSSHLASDDPRMDALRADMGIEHQLVVDALEHRKSNRGDDMLSALLNARDKGRDFSDEKILKLAELVIAAGIDTTAAVLCSTFVILTEQPKLRQRLIDNPKLAISAFEEFVRYSAPTQGVCRTLTRDAELGGQKLRRGDRLMLCFAAACRDPEAFADADALVPERKPNMHVAFGAGTHRCIGSMFARLEFEIIFSTVLRRMPDFQVDINRVTSFDNVGVVMGFTSVPATFTPGERVGADPKIAGWTTS